MNTAKRQVAADIWTKPIDQLEPYKPASKLHSPAPFIIVQPES